MRYKNLAVYAATVILTLLFVYFGHKAFAGYNSEFADDAEIYTAKIISIDDISETGNYFGGMDQVITFTARITGGAEKGDIVACTQRADSMIFSRDRDVEKGDRVLIMHTDDVDYNEQEWIFVGYNRLVAQLFLCGAFLLLIVAIGSGKGVNTIVSLVLSCLVIFLVYIPSILKGFNVYLSTVITSLAVIPMSLLLINGANTKTLCAVLGNLGGILVTALLALFMNKTLKLTGIVDEQYVYLAYINPDQPLNLVAVVWGGMVLGALGAIMDVAMTIASSMHELSEHMQGKTFAKMVRSGMNIGRDAIGTMSNTLILAYIGSSLALVLVLLTYTKNTFYLFSMELIAVEVVQAVAGSMGILFAVPITALFAAYLYNR